jgi:N-methylhydantoinase A/oxoprolinase/acetone carboxylase beta subunit
VCTVADLTLWDEQNIITTDMGGTSFDITLTRDGQAGAPSPSISR